MSITGTPSEVLSALEAMADSHIKRGDYQQDGIKALFSDQKAPPVTGQGYREPTYPSDRAYKASRQSSRPGIAHPD